MPKIDNPSIKCKRVVSKISNSSIKGNHVVSSYHGYVVWCVHRYVLNVSQNSKHDMLNRQFTRMVTQLTS